MKNIKILLVLLVLLPFFSVVSAQEKPPKNTIYTYNNVKWNTLEHDFGFIPHDERVTFDFTFVNLKEEPMLIDNIRTLCGCTAPTWTYDPTLPGAEAKIEIEFDASKEGVFEKYIKVFFKDQRRPDILMVKGEVAEAKTEKQ